MSRVRLCILLGLVAALSGYAQAPNVFENGVVNNSSFIPFGQPGHASAPGTIVAIFGTNLASGLSQSMSVPLSTSLGGVSVRFNDILTPLFYVAQGQIAAQMPFGLTGSEATVVVETAAGRSAPRRIQIAPTSPAIFTLNGQGFGQGIVVFANTVVFAAPPIPNASSRPAQAGDFLTIYANGLGAVNPPVLSGSAAPLTPPFAETALPTVTLGGRDCRVPFSGLVPGLVGLYQVNVEVPTGVTPGSAVPLQISIGGVTSSNLVTIAVQ